MQIPSKGPGRHAPSLYNLVFCAAEVSSPIVGSWYSHLRRKPGRELKCLLPIIGLCPKRSSPSLFAVSAYRRQKMNVRHRNGPRWHVFDGRANPVVDLEPTADRVSPHDGGAGRAAHAPGGPEVGKHVPKYRTIKRTPCR